MIRELLRHDRSEQLQEGDAEVGSVRCTLGRLEVLRCRLRLPVTLDLEELLLTSHSFFATGLSASLGTSAGTSSQDPKCWDDLPKTARLVYGHRCAGAVVVRCCLRRLETTLPVPLPRQLQPLRLLEPLFYLFARAFSGFLRRWKIVKQCLDVDRTLSIRCYVLSRIIMISHL